MLYEAFPNAFTNDKCILYIFGNVSLHYRYNFMCNCKPIS